MRTLFLIFLVVGLSQFAHGAGQRTIVSIDQESQSISINDPPHIKTYHLEKPAEVILNGAPAALSDLAPDMKVRSLTLSAPLSISKIEATAPANKGDQKPEASPDSDTKPELSKEEQAALSEKLSGTYWTHPFPKRADNRPGKYWIRLNPDGTTTASWHSMPGVWKVVAKETLQLQVTGNDISRGKHRDVAFDPAFRRLGTDKERISDPTEEMAKKSSAPPVTNMK